MSHSRESVNELLGHLFRQEAGRMASVLARIFGLEKIDQIEDAIQDAMIAAMRKWPFGGIPENPSAWLIQVAKNKLLDQLRRDKKQVSSDEEDRLNTHSAEIDAPQFASEVSEDVLRMMFACCHPSIPADSQIALTLKIVSGFSIKEIASAFLAKEEAIAKMITRAKKKLSSSEVKFNLPEPRLLKKRLDAVMKVIYLMFNEGYNASEGNELIRSDLCYEAIRLAGLIAKHPVTASPKAHALAAMLFFQGARLKARYNPGIGLMILADQDRRLWDKNLIAKGLRHLMLSARGEELSDYHLEAEIASYHTLAKNFDSTNWPGVLNCYDELLRRNSSAVVALNRAVALWKVKGEKAALDELYALGGNEKLQKYAPYYVTRGEIEFQSGRIAEAIGSFEKALDLSNTPPIKKFIGRKIETIRS